jgi:LmbE family N-acetylglucosaminyl deacetylase
MINAKKILVLAPHTDDGELGCGGTIVKLLEQGAEVHYAAFSMCTRSLPAHLDPRTLEHEVKAATAVLGIAKENLHLFDYDVRYFPSVRQDILEDLVKLNKSIKPDLVLLPNTDDVHQDHQTISAEGIRAFKHVNVMGYELPWNNLKFTSNAHIRLEEKHIIRKAEALAEYKSQAHRNYMNEPFVRGWAQMRGTQAGATFAEAFEVIHILA